MHRQKGISLPQALLEQIQGDLSTNRSSGGHGRGSARKPKLSRKEERKQSRVEKKQRKASHSTNGAYSDIQSGAKRSASLHDDHPDSPARKRTRVSQQENQRSSTSATVIGTQTLAVNSKASTDHRPQKKQASALQKLADRTASVPFPRSQAERDEDAYIAQLEAKLGMGKRGKKGGRGFEDDGLDELLNGLDLIVGSLSKKEVESQSEASSDDETEECEEQLNTSSQDIAQNMADSSYASEWKGFSAEAEDDGAAEEDPSSSTGPQTAIQTSGRYVPPHLRNRIANADEDEALAKLSRQLKGLINRLSEQNIASVLDEIEDLYTKHRRHDMTETLTNLLVAGITSHSSMLDSFVILTAALMSALYKIIGIDFAAYVIQNVVGRYEQLYAALSASERDAANPEDVKSKECSNLIILLSELYNFQVVSCVLVYDIIRTLLDGNLSETDVELLLKLLRNSGQQLRQDDPTALKEVVQIVQTKVTAQGSSASSRTRFMVETLVNLKNNRVKQHAAAQHTGSDSVERLKKFLTGLSKKRHVAAHEPIRVTLNDLHSASSRGKWWLVGAAWSGDPLVERQAQRQAEPESASAAVAENALLKLAKKQGMNTDIRRSIFVVLMSSDDYVDACERLAQLNLTEVQQREIVRVLLHCCGNEKSYNPYYTLVGQQLARRSHSYKITLQFCLWDFLRALGESSIGGVELIKSLGEDSFGGGEEKVSTGRRRNVARAYAWWIAHDAVSLALLKPVDFIGLKPATRLFMRDLLERVLFDTQVRSPALAAQARNLPAKRDRTAIETVFLKAVRIQNLAAGLVYFLGELQKARDGDGEEGGEEGVFYKWATEVAVESLRMGADIAASL